MIHAYAVFGITAAATAGVILRPWRVPEAVWAVSGAALLVALRLLAPADALAGVGKGTDVYEFLIGMMLLAELARREGLFDWLAAHAARRAQGSPTRLFALVYLVGILVTVFLSNDATAVVLTPAVAAVTRAARVENPLPYLLVCAFIANAASFVLPISNPANLVIYGAHLPPLLVWLPRFALPSLLAILATYAVLRIHEARRLSGTVATGVEVPRLEPGARVAALAVLATAGVLMAASALDRPLGLPTLTAGLAAVLTVSVVERRSPVGVFGGVSWSVIPLVAGLFVLVEALDRTGVLALASAALRSAAARSVPHTAAAAGLLLAFGCNVFNNLPAGLVAGTAVQSAAVPAGITSALLVGIDVGPNLSITGSLATILWLGALRRDGHHVRGVDFLKVGAWVMPPALLLALLGLAITI